MENQEQFIKMQMLGQEAEKIEQQIQMIEQQIAEMNAVKESVSALDSNKNKEILANLGKGVFAKAELKGNDFFVNVGKEVLVRKNSKETLKIFDEQMKKLARGKEEFNLRTGQLQMEMQALLADMQESQEKQGHQHNHDSECECEESTECSCEEPCEECECGHSHEEEKKKGKKK